MRGGLGIHVPGLHLLPGDLIIQDIVWLKRKSTLKLAGGFTCSLASANR